MMSAQNGNFSGHVHMGSSISGKGSEEDGMSVSNWGRCLDMILQAEMGSGSPLEGTTYNRDLNTGGPIQSNV